MDGRSGLFAARSAYLDRWVQVGIASGNVISIEFLDAEPDGSDRAHDLLDRLLEYLDEGRQATFEDVETALTVGADHRAIFETVRTIPYGTEWTPAVVLERTAAITDDDPVHAVRRTLGDNPIPIVIPDHRVSIDVGATAPDMRSALRALEGLN